MPKTVELVPYLDEWPALAEQEIHRLVAALHGLVVEVHHIGSTAVPGLSAKPVLDLLLVSRSLAGLDEHEAVCRDLGYRCRGENGIVGRRYYTLDDNTGRRFQLHAFATGSDEIVRHLAFRDYLRAHPSVARAYELEKRRCRDLHPDNSNAYAEAKSAWIVGVVAVALADMVVSGDPPPNMDGGINSHTSG